MNSDNKIFRSILVPYYLILEYLLIVRIKIDERLLSKLPSEWRDNNKHCAILLPGIHSRSHGLKIIGNTLYKKGYRVLTIDELGNNTQSIIEASRILETYILKNNLEKVAIIAHSKGGLIAKYFLDTSKYANKISHVISISTPYKGSVLAYLVGAKDITPNSALINTFKLNNNSIITQLIPRIDNHVVPNRNLVLDGAHNIVIDVIGHTRILHSSKTVEVINKLL